MTDPILESKRGWKAISDAADARKNRGDIVDDGFGMTDEQAKDIFTVVFGVVIVLLVIMLAASHSELQSVKEQLQDYRDQNIKALCAPMPNRTGYTNTFDFTCPDESITRWEQIGYSVPVGNDSRYRIGDG